MNEVRFGNATYETIKFALGFRDGSTPDKSCQECNGYLSVKGGSRNVKVTACIHFEAFANEVVGHLDVKKTVHRHAADSDALLKYGGWNGTTFVVRRDDLTASRKETSAQKDARYERTAAAWSEYTAKYGEGK